MTAPTPANGVTIPRMIRNVIEQWKDSLAIRRFDRLQQRMMEEWTKRSIQDEDSQELETRRREAHRKMHDAQILREFHRTRKLARKLMHYDLDLLDAQEFWYEKPLIDRSDSSRNSVPVRYLTRAGRLHARKLIDAEKTRRFEAATFWVTKFWLPLLASLVGILGAITGLVAVFYKR